jgi:hypothetical protein
MQSSQRCVCWFFIFKGLRDNALCCADPPLRSLLPLLFFLGLFRLVSCGCLLLRLFLGETPAWRFPLVRGVVLAYASVVFATGFFLHALSAFRWRDPQLRSARALPLPRLFSFSSTNAPTMLL